MTECRHLELPDINKRLIEAVWIGHVDCVNKLLEEGADVNADNSAGINVLITPSIDYVDVPKLLTSYFHI